MPRDGLDIALLVSVPDLLLKHLEAHTRLVILMTQVLHLVIHVVLSPQFLLNRSMQCGVNSRQPLVSYFLLGQLCFLHRLLAELNELQPCANFIAHIHGVLPEPELLRGSKTHLARDDGWCNTLRSRTVEEVSLDEVAETGFGGIIIRPFINLKLDFFAASPVITVVLILIGRFCLK